MIGKVLSGGIVTLDVTIEELRNTSQTYKNEAKNVSHDPMKERLNNIAKVAEYLANIWGKNPQQQINVEKLMELTKKSRGVTSTYLQQIYISVYKDIRGKRIY